MLITITKGYGGVKGWLREKQGYPPRLIRESVRESSRADSRERFVTLSRYAKPDTHASFLVGYACLRP